MPAMNPDYDFILNIHLLKKGEPDEIIRWGIKVGPYEPNELPLEVVDEETQKEFFRRSFYRDKWVYLGHGKEGTPILLSEKVSSTRK